MMSRMQIRTLGLTLGMLLCLGQAPLQAAEGDISLTLTSTPAQAVARVDGQVVCFDTPCTVRVARGKHEIDMQLGDHRIVSKTVTLTKDTALNWKLDANAGYLSVRADKEGAQVKLDGHGVWQLPLNALALTPGAHTLTVEARCYKAETQSVTLSAKATRKVELKLKERQGTLRLAAVDSEGKPVAADVYLGEKNLGRTPASFMLPVCTPQVEVVSPKGGQQVVALTLKEGAEQSLSVTLAKAAETAVQGPPEDTAIYQALPSKTSPVRGNAQEALITIVQYSDFQCPFCGRVEETVNRVMEHYGPKVRLFFRDFPLPFHPDARPAARGALAARAQGKYWEMHARLFEHNKELSREEIFGHAKALGLDIERFTRDFDDPATEAEVGQNMLSGIELGLNAVPCFFVNGRKLVGAQPYEAFQALIDSLLPLAEKTGLKGDALYEKILSDRIGQGLSVKR